MNKRQRQNEHFGLASPSPSEQKNPFIQLLRLAKRHTETQKLQSDSGTHDRVHLKTKSAILMGIPSVF